MSLPVLPLCLTVSAVPVTLQVHLAGVGDFVIEELNLCPDPVPLPETDPEKKKVKRTLNAKVSAGRHAPLP